MTSPTPLPNSEIARLHGLRDKKQREASQTFVIEGEKVVGELLDAGTPLLEIYATASWRGPLDDPRVRLVRDADMGRISHFPTPSPVFAVGRINRPQPSPGEFDRGLTLALDGVQDAGNVGTLLRIADWFALDRVLLSPDCADLFSQKVINASMGSFMRVRVISLPLVEALSGVVAPILGCELQGEDVHALPPLQNGILVFGSEGRGLSPAMRARVSRSVTIPRFGRAESLNVAVAAAIVCDNLRRPRLHTQGESASASATP